MRTGTCDACQNETPSVALWPRTAHPCSALPAFCAVHLLDGGSQPLRNADSTVWLAVNGEIFNYKALRDSLPGVSFLTDSDCEPILHLYEAGGDDIDVSALLNSLIGMFAFVLTDERSDRFIAARDHMGIIPLYMYERRTNTLHVLLFLSRCSVCARTPQQAGSSVCRKRI